MLIIKLLKPSASEVSNFCLLFWIYTQTNETGPFKFDSEVRQVEFLHNICTTISLTKKKVSSNVNGMAFRSEKTKKYKQITKKSKCLCQCYSLDMFFQTYFSLSLLFSLNFVTFFEKHLLIFLFYTLSNSRFHFPRCCLWFMLPGISLCFVLFSYWILKLKRFFFSFIYLNAYLIQLKVFFYCFLTQDISCSLCFFLFHLA